MSLIREKGTETKRLLRKIYAVVIIAVGIYTFIRALG